MPSQPLISIVIPNWNGASYLERCLHSLKMQGYPNHEIIIVDNASTDDSVERAQRAAPHALVVRQPRNLGFAAAVNVGIRTSRGEWIAVLNNDTEVTPCWLAECVSGIERHPEAAFLACRILDMKARERIYSAGDCFLRAGIGYRRGQELPDCDEYQRECEIFSASGCAAVYRRSALERAGGFDKHFFAYLEDVDLGLRLRAAGHGGTYIPTALVYHHGGATSGGEFSAVAVRLRTRNSLLLLFKSVPASILWRCSPMIAASQFSWVLRVLAHGRLLSYARGIAGSLSLIPAMLEGRRELRSLWLKNPGGLWREIVKSEAMARRDYVNEAEAKASLFLKWYFRLF